MGLGLGLGVSLHSTTKKTTWVFIHDRDTTPDAVEGIGLGTSYLVLE